LRRARQQARSTWLAPSSARSALVRAIDALETIEPTGPIERVQAWFLLQAYRRGLRGIVELAPEWVGEGKGPNAHVGRGRGESRWASAEQQ
jgi:hypothetical protein